MHLSSLFKLLNLISLSIKSGTVRSSGTDPLHMLLIFITIQQPAKRQRRINLSWFQVPRIGRQHVVILLARPLQLQPHLLIFNG
jgi:hypothetical protein